MNNINLLGLLLLTFFILFSAFNKKGLPTCNRFLINTYAYILFMILFIFNFIETINIPSKTIAQNYFLLKHFILILWLVSFAIILYPLKLRLEEKSSSDIQNLMLIFIFLIVSASILTLILPSQFLYGLSLPLFIGLLGLIFAQIVDVLLGSDNNKTISSIAVVLFTIFISYDTHLAIEASKSCKENKADYIKYSMGLFLDFINLFSSLDNTS